MTKKKTLDELELVSVVSDLESSMKQALDRIDELRQYEDSGSMNKKELAELHLAGEEMKTRSEDPKGRLVLAKKDFIGPRKKGKRKPRKAATRKMINYLRQDLISTESLLKSIDKSEEKFRKYNLPKRIADRLGRSCVPLEAHLEKVKEYIRVTWKEPAKKSRESESKSLMDWIVELDESEDAKKRSASKAMRDEFNEIGSLISRFLVEYFLMISDSFQEDIDESLDEVEAIISCLSIEESSAVIEGFVLSIEFSRDTICKAKGGFDPDHDVRRVKAKAKDGPMIEKKNELFHLIALGILEMEVSFQSPQHSPFDEVFLGMGKDLVYKVVFKDKLKRIEAMIRQMKIELLCGDKDQRTMFYEEALRLGVTDVWKDLDINM